MTTDSLRRLQLSLGYQFNDLNLLEKALRHRSAGRDNNERLEFLGDAILGMVIARELFERFPEASEGQMSRMRASLVKGKTLAKLARGFELGQWLKLGPGEMKSGGHRRDSILADALEAILGAIYLDAGQQVCRQQILGWYQELLTHLDPESLNKDSKTRLQEWLQARKLGLPSYAVVKSEGESHNMTFWLRCTVVNSEGTEIITESQSKNRQQGEQMAAKEMLEILTGTAS